jgi:carbamoyltransferase
MQERNFILPGNVHFLFILAEIYFLSSPIYILGTGLSHDGSACLLKDGLLVVAIEKERLTRRKHDGGNDLLAVQYCLDAAGIKPEDLSLVVQAANFEKEEIKKHKYSGKRLFEEDCSVPFVTISHHLAHAYSAIGLCPFSDCNILVLDGCGSFYHQCDDLTGAIIPAYVNTLPGLYGEKDSYYQFTNNQLAPLFKDFSIISLYDNQYPVQLPTSRHSIGGFYSMVSNYCFGSFDDAGKLMGLAPYGNPGMYKEKIFAYKEGSVWVNEEVLSLFDKPADFLERPLKAHFQYYADIARWVQDELETAVLYIIKERLKVNYHENLCYTGGVALNAVANKRIATESGIKNLYITPAAGDNGLGPGCAFYGWMEVLKKQKQLQSKTVFLGKQYTTENIQKSIQRFAENPGGSFSYKEYSADECVKQTAALLANEKVIGWYQAGAELGPRALGHRSILADPRITNIKDHINGAIKLREDFRPFAPALLKEHVASLFENISESPYMLLIDKIKAEWKDKVPGIVHVDGSCRLQTVTDEWNQEFYKLLQAFYSLTNVPLLLNTSLNRKGMPIVETPDEAIDFFVSSALDVLVLNNFILIKNQSD